MSTTAGILCAALLLLLLPPAALGQPAAASTSQLPKVPRHAPVHRGHGSFNSSQDGIFFATRLEDTPGMSTLERLELLSAKWHALRRLYGALYCSVNGIGPTGGFCLKAEGAVEVGGNAVMVESLCAQALSLVGTGGTILDLGAGFGQYGKCLEAKDPSIKWTGFDGAENIVAATQGRVDWIDLTAHVDLGVQYDWVMSLEVGEHLPKQFEQIYLDNVARHAKAGVITSWAVPGQDGHHHINNQPNEYIIKQYAARGFRYDEATSNAGRKSIEGHASWFKNTYMVFRKEPAAGRR